MMNKPCLLVVLIILACNNRPNNNLNLTSDAVLDTGACSRSDVDTFFIENTDSLRPFAKKWDDNRFWDVFQVDTSLKHIPVFKKLDSLPEIQWVFPQLEEGRKRSGAINHYQTQLSDFSDALACNAYLNTDKDTLWLDIGFSTGFGGAGTTIWVVKNRFKTMPYYFDDIITGDEREPLNFPFSQV